MIDVISLSKFYGPLHALKGVSFTVPKGEICGFLGPNGAGKSTCLRILTGFLAASGGRALVAGLDVLKDGPAARRKMGYLPETNPLYPELRVTETLHFSGQLYGLTRKERNRRIAEVIPRCGLEKVQQRLVGRLSKGNRQRVGLAMAILHEPPILILDEPTSGLDPTQMRSFRDLIFELKGKHTILISSHHIPQVERAADRVVIIADGLVLASGSPDELRARVALGSPVLAEAACDATQLGNLLTTLPGVKHFEATAQGQFEREDGQTSPWTRMLITPLPSQDIREALSGRLAHEKIPLRELKSEAATLEDFFALAVADAQGDGR